MNKKLVASVVTLLTLPMIALAAENFFVRVINNVLTKVLWPVFLGLVIIMFIWAGILYLTARGDPEKFKKANLAVVFAIVGIIVAILGYRIVATLRNVIPGSAELERIAILPLVAPSDWHVSVRLAEPDFAAHQESELASADRVIR